MYEIDNIFIENLNACVEICKAHSRLQNNQRLLLENNSITDDDYDD